MPLKRKLSKTGGSDCLLIPAPILEAMNLAGGDEVVLELAGDTLLVRRVGAQPPDFPRLLVALEALGHPIDLPDASDSMQRVLLCLRAYGPLSAGQVAEKLGLSRRGANDVLKRAVDAGQAVRSREGYSLAG